MLRIIAMVLLGALGFAAAQPAHCALEASDGAAGAHPGPSIHASHAGHAGARTAEGRPDDARRGDHEGSTHDAAADCPALTICGAAALPTLASACAIPARVAAGRTVPLERTPSPRVLSAEPPPPRPAHSA